MSVNWKAIQTREGASMKDVCIKAMSMASFRRFKLNKGKGGAGKPVSFAKLCVFEPPKGGWPAISNAGWEYNKLGKKIGI